MGGLLSVVAAALMAGAAWVLAGTQRRSERLEVLVRRARPRAHDDDALLGGDASVAAPESVQPIRRAVDPAEGGAGSAQFGSTALGQRLAAALAGTGVAVGVGGWLGVLLGVAAALVLARFLRRLEPATVRRRRERVTADLPAAADLLAACLRAGRSIEASVEVVSDVLGGPLGADLAGVARLLRLGADADSAWAPFLAEPSVAPFGRAIIRAAESGAPLAGTLDRIAADARRARLGLARERARAVGVKAAAPLGLCFLPAFLLIGVVPVVISALSNLLS